MAFPPHQTGLPTGWTPPPQLAPGGAFPWEGGATSPAVAAAAGGVKVNHQVSLRPMATPAGQATGYQQPSQQQSLGAKRGAAGAAGGSTLESKRLKRLEKNRESARECRRRKKENKEKLEEQLAALDEENLNLRLQLKVGDEATDAEHSEILEIKARLNDEVSRGVEEAQILQTMDLLKERFADYGSAHTSATEFHLEQLSRLLQPTLTTRACMHAVLQTIAGNDKNSKGLHQQMQTLLAEPNSQAGQPTSEAEPGGERTAETPQSLPDSTVRSTEGGCTGGAGKEPTSQRNLDGLQGGSASDVGTVDLRIENPTLQARVERIAGADDVPKPTSPCSRNSTAQGSAAGGLGGVDAAANGGEWVDMWSSLVAVLEATEEQKAAMRSQAGAISELATDLEGTTDILNRLKQLLADRNQTLDGEMAEIQRILTPTQTAKFVLWVSKNEACVHMLNHLWDKLHGDPSRDP